MSCIEARALLKRVVPGCIDALACRSCRSSRRRPSIRTQSTPKGELGAELTRYCVEQGFFSCSIQPALPFRGGPGLIRLETFHRPPSKQEWVAAGNGFQDLQRQKCRAKKQDSDFKHKIQGLLSLRLHEFHPALTSCAQVTRGLSRGTRWRSPGSGRERVWLRNSLELGPFLVIQKGPKLPCAMSVVTALVNQPIESPRSKCDSLDCEGYSPLLVAVREVCPGPPASARHVFLFEEHPDIANALVRASRSANWRR